jgi:hypothetical protein
MLIVVSAVITWVLSFFVPLAITPEISLRLQQQDISAILAIILGSAKKTNEECASERSFIQCKRTFYILSKPS